MKSDDKWPERKVIKIKKGKNKKLFQVVKIMSGKKDKWSK